MDVTRINIDSIDIKAWANQIRQVKIREFEEYCETVKKHFGVNKSNMHPIVYVRYINRITELEGKLETLKNTK